MNSSDSTSSAAEHRSLLVDGILQDRASKQRLMAAIYSMLALLVVWSVNVTIIEDTDWARMGSFAQVMETAGQFVGLDFTLFPDLIAPTIETLMIACLGTLLGVLICIPAAWFGALNVTPYKPVTYPLARGVMTISRSIHEIVWALFFVSAVGLGALAGIFAIAVRSVGFIAKISAEAIENINPGPVEAIRSVGGNSFQVMIYGILPQILPQVLGVIIFEWEINIRRSAILGLVGAGGLGLVFFRQMNTFNFHGVMSVIVAILFLILIGELLSHWARKSII